MRQFEDDRARLRLVRLVHPVDQHAFVVALAEVCRQAELARLCRAGCVDLGQGGGAVNVGLARAEQVEVGAVEDEEGVGHGAGLAGCDNQRKR